MKQPTEGDIRSFLEDYGTSGKRLTKVLESIAPDIRGIISAGGWSIIKDDVERWQSGAMKMLTGKATDEEKLEVIYLTTSRIPTIIQKLKAWYNGIGIISSAAEIKNKKKKGN